MTSDYEDGATLHVGARPAAREPVLDMRLDTPTRLVSGSGHLHAWSHEAPFPQWAAAIRDAVEAGRFPASQRGDYDLRLDRPGPRREWQVLLGQAPSEPEARRPRFRFRQRVSKAAAPPGGLVVERVAAARVDREPPGEPGEPLPISVVLPIRDRGGSAVSNCLASLAWQRPGPPREVVVVSHGSQPAVEADLEALCRRWGARLLTFGGSDDSWNKPLALNVGLRATAREVPFCAVLDADIVLAPDALATVVGRLQADPPALVLCRILDLPERARIPDDPDALLRSYAALRGLTTPRPRHGTGALQAARRDFFFAVRGYDEDLLWWGAMDGDMVARARLSGLSVEWIDDRTSMLHQWHPRKHRALVRADQRQEARLHWRTNHDLSRKRLKAGLVARNPASWGIPGGTGV